jgi:hypothetical protein
MCEGNLPLPDQKSQTLAHRVCVGLADKRPSVEPQANFDKFLLLQYPKGFPERSSADLELLSQLPLGRKTIARLQLAGNDGFLHLINDILIDAILFGRLEHENEHNGWTIISQPYFSLVLDRVLSFFRD